MSTEQFDLNKLIEEVTNDVNDLIKSEKEKLDAAKATQATDMKKAEASKEESSKEESSKEESSKEESSKLKKDDEGSSYENQAPEASASAEAPPEAPAEEAGPHDGEGTLEEMVAALDDDMLNELRAACEAEQAQRGHNADAAAVEPSAEAAPAPEASPALHMSEAANEADIKKDEKLVKAEEKIEHLEKYVQSMAELLEKMASKPVVKAVSNVDYVDRGETALAKADAKDFTVEEINAELTKISKDGKKLSALSKHERDAMLDFFSSKRKTPEVLKIITK